MRNVIKGFQASKMAIPKAHMANINREFNSLHAPSGRHYMPKPPAAPMPKMPRAPGRRVR